MANFLYQGDLPADVTFDGDIACDTETRGLDIRRDRLCVVQLSDGKGDAHLVQLTEDQYETCTNLKKVLADESKQFIFHYGRFDVAQISYYLGIEIKNIFCTKISSKLARTYTNLHGLKTLVREFCEVEISKAQQTSDWAGTLSKAQIRYAASDVLYLHQIREKLIAMLEGVNRLELAEAAFKFLPYRAQLDILGWEESDIFAHSDKR